MHHLKKFDNQPSNLSLQFNRNSCYKSKTGGVLTLISYLIIVVIAIRKIKDVLEYNHVSVDKDTKLDYASPINISDMGFAILLEADLNGTRTIINNLNQYQYGVNVTLQQLYEQRKSGKEIPNNTKTSQIPFSPSSLFNISLVPNIDTQLLGKTDYFQQNHSDGILYKRLAIRVNICNASLSAECGRYGNNVYFSLIFKNHAIEPSNLTVVTVDPAFRTFIYPDRLRTQETVKLSYFFKKVAIRTNPSIIPEIRHKPSSQKYQTQQTWFYDNDKSQEIFESDDDNTELLKICLKRSDLTVIYTREFMRLDTALLEAFGIIGIVLMVKGIIVYGYNDWSFRKHRLAALKGISLTWTQINLLVFYQDRLRYWVKRIVFRKKTDESEQYLDFLSALQRIEDLQNPSRSVPYISSHHAQVEMTPSSPLSVHLLSNEYPLKYLSQQVQIQGVEQEQWISSHQRKNQKDRVF